MNQLEGLQDKKEKLRSIAMSVIDVMSDFKNGQEEKEEEQYIEKAVTALCETFKGNNTTFDDNDIPGVADALKEIMGIEKNEDE